MKRRDGSGEPGADVEVACDCVPSPGEGLRPFSLTEG